MFKKSFCIVLMAGVFLSGCAAFRAFSARRDYIQQKAQEFTYNKNLDEIWPMARQMLFKKGYQVINTGEGSLTLETKWRDNGGGDRTRYLVQGIKLPNGKSQIQFTRAFENTSRNNPSTHVERDWSTEWELIQLIDPNAAKEIEAGAEVASTTARAG